MNKRDRGSGGGEAGGTTQYVRENYKSLEGTNLTVVARIYDIPLYHLPGIVYYSSRFDVSCGVVCKIIFRCGIQCVIASWCVIVHGSQDRTFQSTGVTM